MPSDEFMDDCDEIGKEAHGIKRKGSTGPRTKKGKAKSALNAVKHGMVARSLIIPEYEKRKTFKGLLRRVRADLQPVGALEELAVEDIAASYFRLSRCYRSEATAFATAAERYWDDDEDFEDDEECEECEDEQPRDKSPGKFSLPSRPTVGNHFRYESALRRRLKNAIAAFDKLKRERAKAARCSDGD